jgi:transposase
MEKVSIVGIDLAKRVFQVHAVDEQHKVVVQKLLSRSDVQNWFGKQGPCLVGMEACATSHYWAQEIGKLGHDVKLNPPTYVKRYVRRQKMIALLRQRFPRPSVDRRCVLLRPKQRTSKRSRFCIAREIF